MLDRQIGRLDQLEASMTDWDAIVASDGPAVWRTLWRLLADRADVEECFQETFLAALRLAEREEVQSWPAVLCSIATARAMDRLRRRYRAAGRAAGARRRGVGTGATGRSAIE